MSNPEELSAPASPGLPRMALELRAPWRPAAGVPGHPLMDKASRGDGHAVPLCPGLD